MKKEMILLAAALLGVVGGCGIEKENKPPYLLHGAWLLQQAEYPSGGETSYDLEGSGTFCVIFEGDSMYYECRLASTPSGLVMMPVDKGMVTLIDKGGGELLYMENNDPHPLTVADSIITIQHDGILHTWVRADDIYREWGNEIRDIIAHDIDQRCTREMARYVLSSIERQQERTIHWFGYFSAFIVLVALVAAHLAFTNRRVRRQLQLQLRQIQEVQENRPQAVRRVVATMENRFFSSDAYATLQKRVASGLLMKEQDWQQVEQLLKTVYPGFTSQLQSLYQMSELEFHTCMLIKLRIAPKDISAVLARDVSTISTVRSRLFQKVFGRKGGAKEWDDFILSIGS